MAGTAPPISTCMASPRSRAQIHSPGDVRDSPGHQTAAETPTRPGERTRWVTATATCGVPPAAAAARAPASAADRAANVSDAQTAVSTAPRASSSATGQANANSTSAVPRSALRRRFNAGFAAES
jgi:hypothetical protein